MEKKNTMLLTVIAVATLLVAVVGATFAYFSISATEESSTTGTIHTANIGLATIESVNTTLTLNLTPENMDINNAGQTFYAKGNDKTTGSPEEANTPIPLVKAGLSEAEDGTTYVCHLTVEVTKNTADEMVSLLKTGWAQLKLTGSAVGGSEQVLDLSTLKEKDGEYTGSFTLTPGEDGSAEDAKNVLNAVLSFTNTADAGEVLNSGLQNDVAGKALKIDIKTTGGVCEIQKKAGN